MGSTLASTSASAPAVSTPVVPPPTITRLTAPCSTNSERSMAASSTARMCERNRSASFKEYMGNVCSDAPGIPREFGCARAAMTRKSAVDVEPFAVVTERSSGLIDTTALRWTSTVLSCPMISVEWPGDVVRTGEALLHWWSCGFASSGRPRARTPASSAPSSGRRLFWSRT